MLRLFIRNLFFFVLKKLFLGNEDVRDKINYRYE